MIRTSHVASLARDTGGETVHTDTATIGEPPPSTNRKHRRAAKALARRVPPSQGGDGQHNATAEAAMPAGEGVDRTTSAAVGAAEGQHESGGLEAPDDELLVAAEAFRAALQQANLLGVERHMRPAIRTFITALEDSYGTENGPADGNLMVASRAEIASAWRPAVEEAASLMERGLLERFELPALEFPRAGGTHGVDAAKEPPPFRQPTNCPGALECHPAAELFPTMTDAEMQSLVAAMKRSGFDPSQPILTLDGKIVDGRSRYRAATLAGVEPVFEELRPGRDPFEEAWQRNGARRDLAPDQRAAIFLKLTEASGAWNVARERHAAVANEARREAALDQARSSSGQRLAQTSGRPSREGRPERTRRRSSVADEMATEAGTSRATLERVRRLKYEAPERFEAVARGETRATKELRELKRAGKTAVQVVEPRLGSSHGDTLALRVDAAILEPLRALKGKWIAIVAEAEFVDDGRVGAAFDNLLQVLIAQSDAPDTHRTTETELDHQRS